MRLGKGSVFHALAMERTGAGLKFGLTFGIKLAVVLVSRPVFALFLFVFLAIFAALPGRLSRAPRRCCGGVE